MQCELRQPQLLCAALEAVKLDGSKAFAVNCCVSRQGIKLCVSSKSGDVSGICYLGPEAAKNVTFFPSGEIPSEHVERFERRFLLVGESGENVFEAGASQDPAPAPPEPPPPPTTSSGTSERQEIWFAFLCGGMVQTLKSIPRCSGVGLQFDEARKTLDVIAVEARQVRYVFHLAVIDVSPAVMLHFAQCREALQSAIDCITFQEVKDLRLSLKQLLARPDGKVEVEVRPVVSAGEEAPEFHLALGTVDTGVEIVHRFSFDTAIFSKFEITEPRRYFYNKKSLLSVVRALGMAAAVASSSSSALTMKWTDNGDLLLQIPIRTVVGLALRLNFFVSQVDPSVLEPVLSGTDPPSSSSSVTRRKRKPPPH